MFEPRRQHPAASITNVLRTLRELLIPIIIVVLLGGGGNSRLMDPYTLMVLLGILGMNGVLGWMRFYYWVEEDELRITYGIFVKKKLFIPKDRIQVIDISSGLVQRMFGLVQVQVQTAGSSSREAKLSAITLEEAKALKQKLLGSEDQEASEVSENQEEIRYQLSPRRLLIAASTASSFGVAFSIVGYVFAQLDQFVSEEMMTRYIEGAVAETTAFTWLVILGAAFIFAWLLSVLGTLFRFSRFSVRKRNEELVITRGLIERKNITVPFDRIQAIRVVEGIFRQPFGYASVFIDSAGYGDEKGESTVLMPLLKHREIPAFLENLVPDFAQFPTEFVAPPPRAIPRFMIRMLVPVLLVVVAVYVMFWDNMTALALFLLPAIFLAFFRYKDAGAAISNDHMVLRFRNLARTLCITRKHRIQAASEHVSWFQKRRNLATFRATVASGKGGFGATVENLDQKATKLLLQWVKPNP